MSAVIPPCATEPGRKFSPYTSVSQYRLDKKLHVEGSEGLSRVAERHGG